MPASTIRSLLVILCLLLGVAQAVDDKPVIQPGQKVLILGDSITHAGGYVDFVNAYLAVKFPDRAYNIVGVGLPSEGVTGLSEPYHPFPRPDVNERLGRALQKFKPDVVIACYGMNDGIYFPFAEERFAKYREGIDKIVADCNAAGAKVILVTPPPFDALPVRGKVRPADAKEFGYKDIYEKYDEEVLTPYAAWIMERGKKDDVLAAVDIHTPINAHFAKMRETNPKYTMSGDGVHVNKDGHRQIAAALLNGLGFPDADLSDETLAKVMPLVAQRDAMLRDAWLSEIGHKRPGMRAGLPIAEAQQKAAELDAKIHEAANAK